MWLYCSLPVDELVWNYEKEEVLLNNESKPVLDVITVAGGTLNLTFDVDHENKKDDSCITTIAKIAFGPQNFSAETFVGLNCRNLENTMTIPVTVAGEVYILLRITYYAV